MVIVLYWVNHILRDLIMNELKIFFYTLLAFVGILIMFSFLEGAPIELSNMDCIILASVIHLNIRYIFKG